MSQTLNISLPANLVKQIDARAKSDFASRSDLLRYAVTKYLKNEDAWEELLNNAKGISKTSQLQSDEEVAKYFTDKRRQTAAK